MPHKPVLIREAIERLALRPGARVLDGTFGRGGHSCAILEKIRPGGVLIALDQDPEALAWGKQIFEKASDVHLVRGNFRNADRVLEELHIDGLDAVIIDIGVSSDQLEEGRRGFSFEREGPLDMRMNPDEGSPASDLVRDLSKDELALILTQFGEERQARRFAEAIVSARETKEILTTGDLAAVIENSLPRGLQFKKGRRPSWARHHPATRVFQALRIAVNDELGALRQGMLKFWEVLKPGGRLVIISFHSLEDRIVKYQFRDWIQSGTGRLVEKKPLTPTDEEIRDNSRSRSAKLRVVEKI